MNISLAQKHHDLNIACAQQLADILRDIDVDDPVLDDYKRRHIASAAGSEKKLRGIPVVGAPGVGGTIAGTNPIAAVIAKERWRDN